MTNPEQTVATERIFRGRIVSLRVDTVRLSGGRESRREIVEHSGSVAVVPLDSQGNVLMVRQYRKPVEQELLEIPAGMLEPGEEPATAARRELEEETGYSAHRIEPLVKFFTSPGFCDEEMHVFLATGLVPGKPNPDEDEQIELVRVPVADVPEMIRRGEIKDGKTIAALLLAIHNGSDGNPAVL